MTSGRDSRCSPADPAAIAKLEELRARGRTNIEVGRMQINLHDHCDAFAGLDEVFDLMAKVAYGAVISGDCV